MKNTIEKQMENLGVTVDELKEVLFICKATVVENTKNNCTCDACKSGNNTLHNQIELGKKMMELGMFSEEEKDAFLDNVENKEVKMKEINKLQSFFDKMSKILSEQDRDEIDNKLDSLTDGGIIIKKRKR